MATLSYLIDKAVLARLEERRFGDLSARPLVRLHDPTGIACWLITAADGDRLYGLGDLGLGAPEPIVVGHAFLSALVGPSGGRLRRDRRFDRRWTLGVWARVAARTGSIVAAEIELARAGEALALSRCAASMPRAGE